MIFKSKTWLTLSLALGFGGGHAQQAEFTDQTVRLGDVNLFYKTAGSGPPVLLLHGFTLSHDQWLPVAKELAKAYTVIIPDLPGHGRSQMPEGKYSFDLSAAYMLGLVDSLGIKQLKGIGHSGGGISLMLMSLHRPNLFESLVLIDASHRVTEEARQFLATDHFDLSDKAFQEYYLAIHPGGRPQIDAIFKAENEIAEKAAFLPSERLSALNMPILLIWGDRDDLIALDMGIELYRALPNAQLWVIPGQGHVPVWPELGGDPLAAMFFMPLVRRFLRQEAPTSMMK